MFNEYQKNATPENSSLNFVVSVVVRWEATERLAFLPEPPQSPGLPFLHLCSPTHLPYSVCISAKVVSLRRKSAQTGDPIVSEWTTHLCEQRLETIILSVEPLSILAVSTGFRAKFEHAHWIGRTLVLSVVFVPQSSTVVLLASPTSVVKVGRRGTHCCQGRTHQNCCTATWGEWGMPTEGLGILDPRNYHFWARWTMSVLGRIFCE